MKVRIFSTEMCPYCKLAKGFLKENNIRFEDIDVGENKEAAEEMIKKSGQTGVPVIEVGDEIIIGFDKEKLKKLLKIK